MSNVFLTLIFTTILIYQRNYTLILLHLNSFEDLKWHFMSKMTQETTFDVNNLRYVS